MASIVFWMSPEYGHVNPTLSLVAGLVRDGHRVRFLTVPALMPQVREVGADALAFQTLLQADRSTPADWRARLVDHFGNADDAYDAVGREISQCAQRVRADVVVVDGIMRHAFGIAPFGLDGPRVIDLFTSLPFSVFGRDMAASETMQRRRQDSVFLCPECFELPERIVEEATYILPANPAGTFRSNNRRGTPPLVYCSLGSHPEEYADAGRVCDAMVQAARQLVGVECVIAIDERVWRRPEVDLPSNCRVVAWADQVAMLARASVAVVHGGLGTIKEAMCCRVPMVVVPFRYDQPMNAQRAVYHGVAESIHPSDAAEADALAGAIRRVMTSSQIARSTRNLHLRFQDAIAEYRGASHHLGLTRSAGRSEGL